MGRIHFYHTVWRKNPTTGDVEPLEGVESVVREVVNGVESTDTATVFVNRLGVTIADMVTNDQGVVSYWLDPGDYNVHFTDPELPERIGPFTVGASAVSGDAEGILMGQLPALVQSSVFSPGDLKCVAYTAPDTGWLLCDGSLLSRVEYEDLFTKIGIVFNTGVGEAVTQFRLPDLRGRIPVGADLSAGRLSASDALGNSGGIDNFLFTVDHIPMHAHGYGNIGEVEDLGYAPILRASSTSGWRGTQLNDVEDNDGPTMYPIFNNVGGTLVNATYTGAVVSAFDGVGYENPTETPIDNMQPYQILNWMIKV